MPACVGICNAL